MEAEETAEVEETMETAEVEEVVEAAEVVETAEAECLREINEGSLGWWNCPFYIQSLGDLGAFPGGGCVVMANPLSL